MGISSFIVRKDQQSFYSLHFDFLNYTVAACSFRAGNFPETFEEQT